MKISVFEDRTFLRYKDVFEERRTFLKIEGRFFDIEPGLLEERFYNRRMFLKIEGHF